MQGPKTNQVNIVYYPQMKKVVDHYVKSTPYYSDEKIISWEEFRSKDFSKNERVIILGRHGLYHHFDFFHAKILRSKGLIACADDTTLILFDWHSDIDNTPPNTQLNCSTWAYLGLRNELYSNLYIIGIDPSGEYQSELNPQKCGHHLLPPKGEILRLIGRIYLYPAAPAYLCLKYFPEYIDELSVNDSVEDFFPVEKGGFVVVKFKGMKDVSYVCRKRHAVVSIDLDVIKRSMLKAVCPQGVMDLDELVSHLKLLAESGSIDTVLISGLTEDEDEQDDWSLHHLSKFFAEVTSLVRN